MANLQKQIKVQLQMAGLFAVAIAVSLLLHCYILAVVLGCGIFILLCATGQKWEILRTRKWVVKEILALDSKERGQPTPVEIEQELRDKFGI